MNMYRVPVIFILALFLTVPVWAQDKIVKPVVRTHIPSLTEITRFSGEIRLFGTRVPYEIPDIRERLEKEVMLSAWNRPQVVLWLKRTPRFFPHIERILKQENLPLDMKYIPIVESALLPHSRSPKGAVGYWQFLKATGKRYGLRIDNKIDERKNLFKSTQAACRYLNKLNNDFGSYILAAAAYNMGEFGLTREIEAQETRDFFSLYLPLETQRYILKILAAKLIIENPGHYGFNMGPQDLYPVFTYSKIKFAGKEEVPLSLIAKSAQISFKTLKDYNPDIRGYYLDGQRAVLVPKGREKGFKKKFASLHREWQKKNRVKFHVVKPGESLTGIASQHKMTLSALLRLNRFSYKEVIHPGDRLLVR